MVIINGPSELTSPDSRIFLRRLQSGNILLVYNDDPEKLIALLSKDDGKTWPYKLTIDERNNISYPDGVEDDQSLIYLTYDRSRTEEKKY